jgi:hypothetical protein
LVFRNDHDPPHFHVIADRFSAKFSIAEAQLISCKGRIRPRDVRVIREWGQAHRNELYLNWRFARDDRPPLKITD